MNIKTGGCTIVYGNFKNVVDVTINPSEGKIIVVTTGLDENEVYKCYADKDKLNEILIANILGPEDYLIDNGWYITRYTKNILSVPKDLELEFGIYDEPGYISWYYL